MRFVDDAENYLIKKEPKYVPFEDFDNWQDYFTEVDG
jgi:hypothetical protein